MNPIATEEQARFEREALAVLADPRSYEAIDPQDFGVQRQVVQLLSEGLSNKLIADRLGISDHTAKFHVNGVMMKLGASTRTEAVVEAVRRGVIRL